MEYTITPSADGNYVVLKIDGDFTAKQMMTCVIESHALGKQLGLRRYLVDVRQARNIDSALGNVNFAYKDMKQVEGVDTRARVAGLVSPGDHSHDFVATVSENAGMFLKLFTDFDEAVSYLLG